MPSTTTRNSGNGGGSDATVAPIARLPPTAVVGTSTSRDEAPYGIIRLPRESQAVDLSGRYASADSTKTPIYDRIETATHGSSDHSHYVVLTT